VTWLLLGLGWPALVALGWLAFAVFAVAWNHWRCTHRPPEPPPPDPSRVAGDDVPDWRREHRRRMR